MTPQTRNRGFTLVELLVAIAVFAIISMAAYGGFDAVLDANQASKLRAEQLDAVQRTFTQMQTDLEQVVNRPIRDDLGDERAAIVYETTPLLLEFTRAGWINPLEQPRSSLQRVAYVLEEDRVYRQYWFDLDRLQGALVTRRLLLDRVERLEFRFLDEQREWQEQWPPLTGSETADAGLPLAIEVIIETTGWGELRRIYALSG